MQLKVFEHEGILYFAYFCELRTTYKVLRVKVKSCWERHYNGYSICRSLFCQSEREKAALMASVRRAQGKDCREMQTFKHVPVGNNHKLDHTAAARCLRL